MRKTDKIGKRFEKETLVKQHMRIVLKRVYDELEPDDGTRVLVERLWPRRLSRERAHVDLWLKEIAPSHGLRTWYGQIRRNLASFVVAMRPN